MNPTFEKLTSEKERLATYDDLSLGQLYTLLESNKSWRIFRNTYTGPTEELTPELQAKYQKIDINKLLTSIQNKKKKLVNKVSPFNFFDYLNMRQYSYEIQTDMLLVMISGKAYQYKKIKDVPYYDTYRPLEIGTAEYLDGKIVVHKHSEPLVKSPGIDSFPIDALTAKHIFIFQNMVYIKNNEWHHVIPQNLVNNVLPCFKTDDMSAVASQVLGVAMKVFPVVKTPKGENVLQGDKLGHYLYEIFEGVSATNKVRFCAELANVLSAIKTNTKAGVVSISTAFPQPVVDEWKKKEETADLVHAKKVTYPATLNKMEKVQAYTIDEHPFLASNQYEVHTRAIYTVSTGSYLGIQVPEHIMENTRFRTDFEFLEFDKEITYIIVEGVNQSTVTDVITYIMSKPGVMEGEKLLKEIGIVSASVTATDISYLFYAHKDKIKVGKERELVFAAFIESEVAEENTIQKIRAHTAYINLSPPPFKDIVTSSVIQVDAFKKARRDDFAVRAKNASTYRICMFYYPTISRITNEKFSIVSSCFPHIAYCLIIYSQYKLKFPSWQQEMRTEDDFKQYHKLALHANVTRAHYFLSNKKVWTEVSKRYSKYIPPTLHVPTTYYRRTVKGSMSQVTIDELEEAVEAYETDPEPLKKILDKDAAVGMAFVAMNKPAIFDTVYDTIKADQVEKALVYYAVFLQPNNTEVSHPALGDVPDVRKACSDAFNLLTTRKDFPRTQEGAINYPLIPRYLAQLGNIKIPSVNVKEPRADWDFQDYVGYIMNDTDFFSPCPICYQYSESVQYNHVPWYDETKELKDYIRKEHKSKYFNYKDPAVAEKIEHRPKEDYGQEVGDDEVDEIDINDVDESDMPQ